MSKSPFKAPLKKLYYDGDKGLRKSLYNRIEHIKKLRKKRTKLDSLIKVFHDEINSLNSDITGLRLDLNHDSLTTEDVYEGEFQRETTLQNRNVIEYKFRMEDAFTELLELEAARRKVNNEIKEHLIFIEDKAPNFPISYKKDIRAKIEDYDLEIKNTIDYVTSVALGASDEESEIELNKMIKELNESGVRNVASDSVFFVQ